MRNDFYADNGDKSLLGDFIVIDDGFNPTEDLECEPDVVIVRESDRAFVFATSDSMEIVGDSVKEFLSAIDEDEYVCDLLSVSAVEKAFQKSGLQVSIER